MDKEQLAFALCPISNQKKWKLLHYYNTIDNLWHEIFLEKNENETLNFMKKYYYKDDMKFTKKHLDDIGAGIVTIEDEKYPRRLKEISNPPLVIFYKGNIDILNDVKTIGIVGARNYTPYGRKFTTQLMEYLSQFEVNIISGGAIGIDSMCHDYAMKYGLKTTAVYGCGIDICYPEGNYKLFENISKKGVLISEFLPGTQPKAYNFPIRNRIISGLSSGIIAIEAAEKSGTVLTAKNAIEQGKDVFALQGSFFDLKSKGCNDLLNNGAYSITSMDDIKIKFGLTYKSKISSMKDKNKEKIFSVISDNPIYIDDLIRLANIDINTLYELLFELQLENLILCVNGNYYVRNI